MARSKDIFWGVDLSTRAISIGWKERDGIRGVKTIDWEPNLHDGRRLSRIYHSVFAGARSLAIQRPAVFVYVEQPSGTFNKLPLTYAAGVIQAAIFDALYDHWRRPVEVITVPSGKWKKEICGNGRFGKNDRSTKEPWDLEAYPAMVSARLLGYEGDSWDEADATCIAEYAERNVIFS